VLIVSLFFFESTLLYYLEKENTRVHVQIQKHTKKIQGKLLPPYYAKDPEQQRNYKENPGSFAIQQHSNSPPPDIATGDENERHHELKKPHRTQALIGVAVEKAFSGRPSTGAAPQLLQLPDPRSPSTASIAEGEPSQIRPPILHQIHSLP